jgi:hypothetical protein
MVYIAEAHALSEWPVRSARFSKTGPILVQEQPSTLQERCELARRFSREYNIPEFVEILVDNPEQGDQFSKTYSPWPLRLYIIRDAIVQWIAQPKDCSYDAAVYEMFQILEHSD